MLPADQRLRDSSAFRRTVRSGRRAGGPALVVHLLEHPGATTRPRAGFVVPRAVGNAVVRNRVRRRLRPIVRDRLAALTAGTELVVRVQPPAASLGSAELGMELDRCLTRVRTGTPTGAVP